mmetsp:Transcript_52724/g.60590  ORF Transcript_52724/g.60590 Transcript_52724/m.60590 type:complete len:237 (+) Transcript_52724:318-1028(+)
MFCSIWLIWHYLLEILCVPSPSWFALSIYFCSALYVFVVQRLRSAIQTLRWCGGCGGCFKLRRRSSCVARAAIRVLQLLDVDSELDCVHGRSSAEVVHACLQALLPCVKVHGRQLADLWGLKEQVERLALVNVLSTRSSHVNEVLLANLPHDFVQVLQVLWHFGNTLHRAVSCNDLVSKIFAPQTTLYQIHHQILVHDGEFTTQNATKVDIRRERFEALVVAENLRCGGRRHRSHE